MHIQKHFLKYGSSKSGLALRHVEANRKKFGANVLSDNRRDGFFMILLKQLGGFFSITLFVAATILLALHEYVDFYIIMAVVFLNVTIETIQRYRSDSIFETLVRTLPAYSLVVRDGMRTKIESSELVPGDVIILTAGDKVPADGFVFYAQDFRVDEAILTGESRPVAKSDTDGTYTLDAIIDNRHAVFSGSYVQTGEAHVLVAKVGNQTQIGQIAQKASTADGELPIQKNIRSLSFAIFAFVACLSLFAFFVGVARMQPTVEIFKTTVALFVSAIPESLPVMLTLVLAYGFKRMGDKHVLVRKMQSLDVLGQIDILALDKTGTITRNQMKVEKVYVPDGTELYVTGDGYEPKGVLVNGKKHTDLEAFPHVSALIEGIVLSSDGTYGYDSETQEWALETGDPTEVAMLVLGQKFDITKESLEKEYKFVENIPFNNQKMYHETVYKEGRKELRFTTGAPEAVISLATHVHTGSSVKAFSDAHHEDIRNRIQEYSAQGYRVLACCVTSGSRTVLLGLVVMSDSIRSDVEQSVREVHERGIEIAIITGDHAEIALQVARRIGLSCDDASVLTGDDMKHLSDRQLQNVILQKRVFARVTPQQKLKILEMFKRAGKVMAMTGDGVNDSLALVKADIGIAMGKSSSEAAKASADIVLLDNRFGSIVYGIEEGKNIFSNIKKTILFLLSTNFAEVFVVVFALTLALPLPLSAISILWLNLVTDTFLVIGFAFERGTIKRQATGGILGVREWASVIHLGMIMTCIALTVFIASEPQGLAYAQGMTLLVLIVMQWFNVFNIRAGSHSVFAHKQKFNPVFIGGLAVSFMLTLVAFNTEFMRQLLQIQPIGISDWLYAVCVGSLVLWLEEARKAAKSVKLFSKRIPDLGKQTNFF